MWLAISWIFTLIIVSATVLFIAYMKFCSDNNVKMFAKYNYDNDIKEINKEIEEIRKEISELKEKK